MAGRVGVAGVGRGRRRAAEPRRPAHRRPPGGRTWRGRPGTGPPRRSCSSYSGPLRRAWAGSLQWDGYSRLPERGCSGGRTGEEGVLVLDVGGGRRRRRLGLQLALGQVTVHLQIHPFHIRLGTARLPGKTVVPKPLCLAFFSCRGSVRRSWDRGSSHAKGSSGLAEGVGEGSVSKKRPPFAGTAVRRVERGGGGGRRGGRWIGRDNFDLPTFPARTPPLITAHARPGFCPATVAVLLCPCFAKA